MLQFQQYLSCNLVKNTIWLSFFFLFLYVVIFWKADNYAVMEILMELKCVAEELVKLMDIFIYETADELLDFLVIKIRTL